jgi:hypothetical protein
MHRRLVVAALIVGFAASQTLSGHHSFAATYDGTKAGIGPLDFCQRAGEPGDGGPGDTGAVR